MTMTRRGFVQASLVGVTALTSATELLAGEEKPLSLILAPSNLGLRPPRAGHEPGTWRAPQTLIDAGLAEAVRAAQVLPLERPTYSFEAQPGTSIRNGHTIRAFTLQLAGTVRGVLERGGFPLVIGGDCSILLGGLYGLRLAGGRGLVHVDGHRDFYQLSDQDTSLGAAAGMDLALASGRGDPLVTSLPGIGRPLARDEDIVQIGDREVSSDRDRIPGSGIAQITARHALAKGTPVAASSAIAKLEAAGIRRAWLHVDLDVLDQKVMPAVDSPGSPGLDFEQLADLVGALRSSGRIAGADFAIYDPELDPDRRYAHPITQCIARGIRG
jgi:arginase